MITNIKLRKILCANGILNKKIYSPVDITNQLEMPSLDSFQQDGVLDTNQIVLLNRDKMPLKPFTRMILSFTDTNKGEEHIEYLYRYVENDRVTNIAGGTKPIYRHNVGLIEITKILEREIVDTLKFTNYLEDSYGASNVLDYKEINSWQISGFDAWVNGFISPTITNNGYSNGNRFIGPYRILYKSGYKVCDSSTDGALLVVDNSLEAIDNDKQIKLKNVYPAIDKISINDYVYYYDATEKNTISTDIKLNINVKYSTSNVGSWVGVFTYGTFTLKEYYVSLPSGNRVELELGKTFCFTQTGSYKFYQRYVYYAKTLSGETTSKICCDKTFVWEITIVNAVEDLPQKYNIIEVINRVLDIGKIRRIGNGEEQKYYLDNSIKDRLDILSPEFSLTQGTLFEVLLQLGNYIHGIPRLIPKVSYEYSYDNAGNVISESRNDYTNWNIITFDFLGGTLEYKNNNYSMIELEHPMEDYATNFVSNIQNATASNYNNETTITEPFNGGFVSTRTESSNFEISNDNCVFKTKYPIRALISVKVYCKGKVVDITDFIVEKSKFDTLYTYSFIGDVYKNKAFYLYYIEGERNIKNLEYIRPHQTSIGIVNIKEAIKNILSLDAELKVEDFIKDLAVQIKYIPYQNLKVRQYKTLIDLTAENADLFYNQQSNELDIDAYGKSIKYALLKTGNIRYNITQYFNNLKKSPICGMLKGNYYGFCVNREISYNSPLKMTSSWSKDYNEMYAFTEIKKNVRQYEISEKESELRNPDYHEFCVVDTSFDLEDIFTDTSLVEVQKYVVDDLSTLGFASQKLMQLMADKLSNKNSVNKSISFAVVKTIATDRAGKEEKHCFLLPVESVPFGNSVVLHITMDDNYSAGTFSLEGSEVENNNSYAIESYITYGNEFGRFDSMGVGFGSENPIISFENNIKYNSKLLYKIDEVNINKESILIDYISHPFKIDKDSREQISLTTQLDFVTPNNNIIIGDYLPQIFPFNSIKQTTYKFVYFLSKPNKFVKKIDANSIYNMETPETIIDEQKKFIKIISPTACTDAVGYGIIDNNYNLCIYVDKCVECGQVPEDIYLMFRKDI